MIQIKAIVLAFCICCILAGTVRTLLPESSFKPVINSVLVLYILATLIQCIASLDLQALKAAVQPSAASVPTQDYSDYVRQNYQEQLREEVSAALREQGIGAEISVTDSGSCEILLDDPTGLQETDALLKPLLGANGYTIAVKGGAENES